MKAKELREKSTEELKKLANEERSKLSQIRFSMKANQTKNHNEVGQIKRNIARVLTLLREGNLNNK